MVAVPAWGSPSYVLYFWISAQAIIRFTKSIQGLPSLSESRRSARLQGAPLLPRPPWTIPDPYDGLNYGVPGGLIRDSTGAVIKVQGWPRGAEVIRGGVSSQPWVPASPALA